jgi:hypothetical protein
MGDNNQASLTDDNLDRLAEFLSRELEQPTLAAQIPNRAHLFYGAYDDAALTQANLQLVSKTLLGIILGYVEDAPLIMLFEYEPGKQMVIDLSDEAQKGKARTFVEGFQEQSQHEMAIKVGALAPA